jgi:phosphoglycerate kinase
MHKLSDFNYKNKRVLLRVDLNVPVLAGEILDSTRINKIIPTIKYLQSVGAKVIIASHFGRPKGAFDPSMSLEFLSSILASKLSSEVLFCLDAVGEVAEKMSSNLSDNQVLLLENLRFYSGETKNDLEFARQLAKLADFYINDAFSCSHRAHASIDKIREFLPSAMGLLLAEEIDNLSQHLLSPNKPMMAIVGGSKVSTKLDLLSSLMNKVDYLVIGGAMANTFLKAKGYEIGNSFYEEELLDVAREIAKNKKIILPQDVVVAQNIAENAANMIVDIDSVPVNQMILDIGPKTTAHINELLKLCKTVVMNGPLGVFEFFPFSVGTVSVAREIARLTNLQKLVSIAGGGDIVAALVKSGLFDQFTYISTAGGAFLEWLEGKNLPGLQ